MGGRFAGSGDFPLALLFLVFLVGAIVDREVGGLVEGAEGDFGSMLSGRKEEYVLWLVYVRLIERLFVQLPKVE